jgi:lambda repressor-like predicted transcriptional regulator
MYNASLFQAAQKVRGLNYRQIALAAGVDPKTVKKLITKGEGSGDKAFAVARALGIDVERDDLSPILARPIGKKEALVLSEKRA